ncbi:MAG TPA: DUF305 domain-containing protein [Pseudolabrys sp.]|jgi:uncharacterized protein (DUF305 family)|nr:DUF305 domain-containing protein [Pseudolabrys sp.]
MHAKHYMPLAVMTALSFIAMYILMYAMVDRLGYVYNSLNQVWMAGLMAAPMALIEIAIMRKMYPDQTVNYAIMAGSIIAGILFFTLIRFQVGIGDAQFIRSMIPHHSGAILMCREASVSDAELKKLCGEIIASQQREIEQMQAIFARLKR